LWRPLPFVFFTYRRISLWNYHKIVWIIGQVHFKISKQTS
jgi:hypothetical protein